MLLQRLDLRLTGVSAAGALQLEVMRGGYISGSKVGCGWGVAWELPDLEVAATSLAPGWVGQTRQVVFWPAGDGLVKVEAGRGLL